MTNTRTTMQNWTEIKAARVSGRLRGLEAEAATERLAHEMRMSARAQSEAGGEVRGGLRRTVGRTLIRAGRSIAGDSSLGLGRAAR